MKVILKIYYFIFLNLVFQKQIGKNVATMKEINNNDWVTYEGKYLIGITKPTRNDFVKSGAGKKSNPVKSPANIEIKIRFSSKFFL